MSLKIKKLVNTVLVGATILGGAIAFQSFTKSLTPPVGDHVLVGDRWEPKTNYPNGECLNAPELPCSYTKIGSAPGPMNDEFKNPANFQIADYGDYTTNE